MHIRHALLSSIAVAAVLGSGANAQSLEEYYAGASNIFTGYEKPIRLAPAVVETIDRERIDALNAITLNEVIDSAAGIFTQKSRVGDSIINIRSFYSELNPQLLLMIDGQPIDDPVTGGRPAGFDWLAANIERIEIIRGPGSAVFGADAFLGVINIVTKGAARTNVNELGAWAGTFGTFGGHAIRSFEIGSWDASLTIQGNRTAGDDPIVAADAQSLVDAIFGTESSLAPAPIEAARSQVQAILDLRLTDELKASAWYGAYFNADQLLGSSYILDDDGDRNVHLGSLFINYRPSIGETAFDVKGSVLFNSSTIKNTFFPAGAPTLTAPFAFPFDGVNKFNVKQFEARFETTLIRDFGSHTIRAGAGMTHQNAFETSESRNFSLTQFGAAPLPSPALVSVESIGNPKQANPVSRSVGYFLLQDEWKLADRWTLTVGGRFDHYSDFGGTFNPRASLVWTPDIDTTVKMLYGAAFRAPTFVESFAEQSGPIIIANPDLAPETIDTFEVSFQKRISPTASLTIDSYYYKAEDVVEISLAPNGVTTFMNGAGIAGAGVETALVLDLPGPAMLDANYAHQRAWRRDTRTPAPNAPRHVAFANLSIDPSPQLQFDANVKYVGRQFRSITDPRPPLKDYTRVDFVVAYNPPNFDRVSVSLAVKNVLNAEIFSPITDFTAVPGDLPQEGRQVIGSIKLHY